ncbi:uncharacterized protein LOC134185973 isoform X2 [Corticium candelabrum]|uniref:uncharacterized protein LOC134185973 isoform X2 n=1 Tax=Corticium candelabrum TaxID=121492 RepID=UPI002E25EE54|nr:uncharacterized protein LOC134185973 isoform X2 [Corticium candelabrum]
MMVTESGCNLHRDSYATLGATKRSLYSWFIDKCCTIRVKPTPTTLVFIRANPANFQSASSDQAVFLRKQPCQTFTFSSAFDVAAVASPCCSVLVLIQVIATSGGQSVSDDRNQQTCASAGFPGFPGLPGRDGRNGE